MFTPQVTHRCTRHGPDPVVWSEKLGRNCPACSPSIQSCANAQPKRQAPRTAAWFENRMRDDGASTVAS